MYHIDDKFLYEILDDYKDSSSNNEKNEIINCFMKLLWSSKNKRNIYEKHLRFFVNKSLLNTEIGQIFNTYSDITYISYKSMTKNTDFVSLLRQKINNIYTNLCDGDMCLKKEYMDLMKLPKQMYYRWKSGEKYDPHTLSTTIESIFKNAELVKEKYRKQKMNISWNEYKTIITPFFKKMFENFIPLEYFEDKTVMTLDINMWNEDNFAVAYLCKGLDGYMRNYQKEYYNIKRNKPIGRCECGGMFIQSKNNNRFKCDKCGSYQPQGIKMVECIECHELFEVDGIVKNKKRCDKCQDKKNKERYIKYNNKRK